MQTLFSQLDLLAPVQWLGERLNWAGAAEWAAGTFASIALLYLLCRLLRSVVRRALPHVVETAIAKNSRVGDGEELAKRYRTLSAVGLKTFEAILWLMFVFMSLSKVGLDISPIIAGVGVAGIAIGFGAQSVVKDTLAGIFILLENQYGKGDVVKIAGISGLVEDVNLRRTVLRDQDGTLHNVPNGEVRVASNMTRDFSRVNLTVLVSYSQDLDGLIALIDGMGFDLASDPTLGQWIIEPPKVIRVEGFEENGVTVRIIGTTKPGKQWEIAGEMRRRIAKAFQDTSLELPITQRLIVSASPAEEQKIPAM